MSFNPLRPLAERTVIVTRPRAQASALTEELESFGAHVAVCPMIETVAPDSYAELDRAIKDLQAFDWVIFTSSNAVTHFTNRLKVLGFESAEMDDVRCCAIGEATADALRDVQIHVDVMPPNANAESVYQALRDYFGGDDKAFANLNFLLPRSTLGREYLPQQLQLAGARVTSVAAYKTVRPSAISRGKLTAMLACKSVDCITFASPSSVNNFVNLFDNVKAHSAHEQTSLRLPSLLTNVALACIGETTAEAARRHNLHVAIVSERATVAAFARAIADYYTALT